MTTIVIAWVERDGVRPTGRQVRPDGVNDVAEVEACLQPHAVVWLNKGREADWAKAMDYAVTLGHTVVRVYALPTTTKDPLGVARRLVMAAAAADGRD